jgi:1,4-dihydroxy-2-naphthoate polyprenyltransferase
VSEHAGARVPGAGEPRGRAGVWIAGARPRTLGASIAPVLVGTAAAVSPTWPRALACLVVALALQVGVNYANDYSDGVRRVDTAARVGPVRLTASGLASPGRVRAAAVLSFGIAGAVGAVLALLTSPWLLVIGAAAIGAAILYSGGPRPYAARGLGEVSVFVFFGLFACTGTAYVQGESVLAAAWWGAVAVGLMAVAILVANNLRDIPTDGAAGKRTLAVRLGDARTRVLYRACVALAFATVAIAVAIGEMSAWGLLAFAALPVAARPFVAVGHASGRALVPVLVATAALDLVFGVALAVGLWIARI